MAGAASQAGDADSSRAPDLTSGLQGPWMSTVVLYCWCHSDGASVHLYFTLLLLLISDNKDIIISYFVIYDILGGRFVTSFTGT